ncbi:MAG TPA: hypothetical protein VMT64_10300 [Candidatus Binataceae bacterium]|nr:hypothetical protein [Candidatus Binataceae bacterium]
MKKVLLSLIFVAFTGGIASAQVGGCMHNNSRACVDARNAFAEHHGGLYPGQYYQGYRGNWYRANNDWRWRSEDGREYWNGPHGWEWHEAREHHHHW